MMNSRAIAIPLCALVMLLMRSPVSGAGESTQTAPGGGTGSATSGHVLPLFQDKVPEAYREHVPLPYGVSFTYFRMDERLTLSDPSLVFNGQPIPKQLLQADSVATLTNSYSARFDAWILPFLNVYGTATRISGDATDIRAQLVGFPPVIPERVSYSGTGYGVGLTVAFGYRAFFASYDWNWNWQTAGVLSNTTVANVQGPRVGVQFTPWGYQGIVYVGAMRQMIRGRQSGSIDLPGAGSLAFDLKAEPEHTWNPAVGAELGLTRQIRANLEAGFGGRKYLLLGAGYRF
jgi:hypothetical protein